MTRPAAAATWAASANRAVFESRIATTPHGTTRHDPLYCAKPHAASRRSDLASSQALHHPPQPPQAPLGAEQEREDDQPQREEALGVVSPPVRVIARLGPGATERLGLQFPEEGRQVLEPERFAAGGQGQAFQELGI